MLRPKIQHIKAIKDLEWITDFPIGGHTTMGTGGKAKILLRPKTPIAFSQCLYRLKEQHMNPYILGKGSNIIVGDSGVDCVIDTKGMDWIKISGNTIEAGSGLSLKRLISEACKSGLSGLEDLSGIPGSVGGAVIMNAGAHESTISECLTHVLLVGTDHMDWFPKDAFLWGYRSFELPQDLLKKETFFVGAARFELTPKSPKEIRERIKKVMRRRARTQPIGARTAGCVFKNPEGGHAGRLIELSGLKGARYGDAAVSLMHANFIVNLGGAKSSHVIGLMEKIREKVFKIFGVALEPEVKGIGVEVL